MLLCRILIVALFIALAVPAAEADQRLAQQIFKELVDTNTAPSGGSDTSEAVAGLVDHLRDAGFTDDDIGVVALDDKLVNLVVRYRSPRATEKPILMMAHLDVVEALPEDWSVAPFNMIERDGYFYGRGTVDNKAGAAIIVANLIRLKREGFRPNRDLIVMLTADEETTGASAYHLANDRRDLIDAEFALNTDGGMVILEEGEPKTFVMQTSEKVYVSFRLQALDPGGHSSLPRPDNPIYRIARYLEEQQRHPFPIDLNATSRAFFAERAGQAPESEKPLLEALANGDLDDAVLDTLPQYTYYNALARTTCVPTQIDGGHAENALPQTATVVINCRIVPQTPVEEVMQILGDMAAPYDISIEQVAEAYPSPPSPLTPSIVEPIRDVATEMWPGIEVVPEMSTGATDGLFMRNVGIPVYAVSAIAEDPNENRIHGKDERIRVESFNDSLQYWYRLVKRLSGG